MKFQVLNLHQSELGDCDYVRFFSPGVCDRYNKDRVYGKRILTLEFCGIWCYEIFLVK